MTLDIVMMLDTDQSAYFSCHLPRRFVSVFDAVVLNLSSDHFYIFRIYPVVLLGYIVFSGHVFFSFLYTIDLLSLFLH